MPLTLGADHLANNKSYESQRSNNFEFRMAGLPADVTLLVVSFPLPSVTVEALEIAHGNSSVSVAGKVSYSEGELVIKDAIGADIEKIIEAWHHQVYDPKTDKIGFAADYKRQGSVDEFAPDGSYVRTWTLRGCWPTVVNYGELNNESNDKKTITATIKYDKAWRE